MDMSGASPHGPNTGNRTCVVTVQYNGTTAPGDMVVVIRIHYESCSNTSNVQSINVSPAFS